MLKIGITGGSASGKTTLGMALVEEFRFYRPAVIHQDNYYWPIEKQKLDAIGKANFDLPTSIDAKKVIDDLRKLAKGQKIVTPEYSFNNQLAPYREITTLPSKLIFLEGQFILTDEELMNELDFLVFLDVDPTLRYEQRQIRDTLERGYTNELIDYQWKNHVIPCFDIYIKPFQSKADVSVQSVDEGLEAISRFVKSKEKQLR